MRYTLNGQFTVNGVTYWRIEDVERMQRQMEDGTYSPVEHIQQFGVAVNATDISHEHVREMVAALNGLEESRKQADGNGVQHAEPANDPA